MWGGGGEGKGTKRGEMKCKSSVTFLFSHIEVKD